MKIKNVSEYINYLVNICVNRIGMYVENNSSCILCCFPNSTIPFVVFNKNENTISIKNSNPIDISKNNYELIGSEILNQYK